MNNSCSCPDSYSIHDQNVKRITNARKRWRILARVLRRNSIESVNSSTSSIDCLLSSDKSDNISESASSPQTSLDSTNDTSSCDLPLSVRTFDGNFNIVQQIQLSYKMSIDLLGNPDEDWFTYQMCVNKEVYHVNVHHINRLWTAQDLIGFNNTGNICVWPSEECLTYYLLEHIHEYKNQMLSSWVLELGGGMTCLAGLMIAKYFSNLFLVHLSDGNELSVENIKRSIKLNDFNCFIKASVLTWENSLSQDFDTEKEKYSLILCADCLFFDESRDALVHTINYYLSPKQGAKALIMAPRRGQTMEMFIKEAQNQNLKCQIVENYSDIIYRKHLALKETSQDYNEDIHYPLLIIVNK